MESESKGEGVAYTGEPSGAYVIKDVRSPSPEDIRQEYREHLEAGNEPIDVVEQYLKEQGLTVPR